MATSLKPSPAELRRQRKRARERFAHARRATLWYERSLRKIADQISLLLRGANLEEAGSADRIASLLERYGTIIEPWAETAAQRMLADLAARDAKAWVEFGRTMGYALRHEIETAPTGTVMREALARQVELITSLPTEAAQRVHHLTREALTTGRRAADIADEIYRTGEVTRNRATLIARTEVARTSAELTEARARHIDSPGYIWRATMDRDTRTMHRKLNGRVFRWDDPPIAEVGGQRHHPGKFPNCRCWPEVLLPDVFLAAA